MCIRITKELKTTYESDVKIDLGKKIAYPVFVKILSLLGYLNSYKNEMGQIETKMTDREEQLVELAWQTVKTKFKEQASLYLDNTQIRGVPWSELKEEAMQPDFEKSSQYASYTQEE